jgi:hypothetical protein
LAKLAADCCEYEPVARPSFVDICQRLEESFAELPPAEVSEMQRLVQLSQAKVEAIRKESERAAMEKIKSRLLEASHKLDTDSDRRRQSQLRVQGSPSQPSLLVQDAALSFPTNTPSVEPLLTSPLVPPLLGVEQRGTTPPNLQGIFLPVLKAD